VYHVLNIKKNLVAASLLIQLSYKVLLASDKVIISRHGSFISKGYLTNDGLFKLNVIAREVKNLVHSSLFVTNVKSSNSWHSRLGQVNLSQMDA